MQDNIHNELNQLNSFLKDIPKTSFTSKDIPAGYFDTMESRFFENLKSVPKETSQKSIFSNFNRPRAVAAVVALMAISFFIFKNYISNNYNFQLSDNEIYSYLNENYEELDTNSIDNKHSYASVINKESFSIINDKFENISNDDIKKYLIEEEGLELNTIN